jgi:UDPglucose--hexose-1-phosphate uridylyltransferase
LPELRTDPLSGLKVIVAGERAERPGAFLPPAERPPIDVEADPFAPGHEDRTPPELDRDGDPWTVRVVPNLFPALSRSAPGEGGEDPLAGGRGQPDLFASRPAAGGHEVVVNAPESVWSLSEVGADQVERAMEMWRRRMRAHAEASYVHVIVNEGREAGASLAHTHSQLYALPLVPGDVARERERFTAYSDRTQGRNLLEDVVQEEVRRRERLVAVDSEAVLLCPFASRVPFHMQLVPRRPAARFEDEGPLGAALLHGALGRLRDALGGLPPLNMWVRTAPRGAEHFCWRIEILPRLAQLAGLELGTGIHLNVLAPESAADRLR